jgi:WD40 repeat protein/serine/threonine protein kinase
MIPVTNQSATEESEVEALLAFDRALAAGDAAPTTAASASFLKPVHECQRLLEAVWPRSGSPSFEGMKQFGRFSVVRELGRGGFGVVFLAEDSVLGRRVALKVPRPEVLVTPEVRRRFLREAEAASRLDHPHIVPVYEVGEEGPICYIASAYCEGLTLAQWLRQQTVAVPIRLASRLAATLAVAVAHAHERGIVHRDLKPSNILLQQCESITSTSEPVYDELGLVPRICDFGLAKLLDQVSRETRSGVPIGSPVYMAPEQASGRPREHGPATDVYALGVILYELLTGQPPHRGETDLETLRLVCEQDPPSPRALRPGLPRDLETIALKCLEKRPTGRYSSAIELANDLQRFLDGRPVLARPVPPWERARKWVKRRPAHAALAAALAALGLAAMGGLEWTRVHNEVLRQAHDHSRLIETEARDQHALVARHRLLAYQRLAPSQLKLAGALAERGEHEAASSILDTLRPPDGLPDSRGFPWYYLHRLVQPSVRLLTRLPTRVRAVASPRRGRMIALADDASNTFLMDCESGSLRELPATHRLRLCISLVFSPDGRTLASLSRGGGGYGDGISEVKLWDIETGAELTGMTEGSGLCYQIVFSPDGSTLVTVESALSNPNPPVRSWRLSDDRKRVALAESLRGEQLRASLSPGKKIANSADGGFRLSDVLAVSAEDDPTTAVWSETGEIWLYSTAGYCTAVCRVQGPEVVFIPRTDLLVPYTQAAVDAIGKVACALTGSARARPIRPDVAVLWARFSRDGRTAALHERDSVHVNGKLRLVDVASGRVRTDSPWSESWSGCTFDFVPDGEALVLVGRDTQAQLWDLRRWRVPEMLDGHKKEVWGLAFSPDSKTLISSSDDSSLKLWDVGSGMKRMTLEGHGSLVSSVAYSPDGTLLASSGWDSTIRLWNAATGAQVATLSGHTKEIRTLAFSPDGKTLASGGDDQSIRLWDVPKRRSLGAPLPQTDRVFAIAFAPGGKTLYSGAQDKTVKLWNWKEGRCLASWDAEDFVYALAISPDGDTLAAAQSGGTIRLWDVAKQESRPPLRGHLGAVLGVAFSPNGNTLASAGRDHSVRLWDPASGHELLTLNGHAAPVHAITFSPDGTILATGSHDGAIKLWRTAPGTTEPATIASLSEPSMFIEHSSASGHGP